MKQFLFLVWLCVITPAMRSQTITAAPNPFPKRTLASYTTTIADSVSLQIVNALGQLILIIPNSFKQPGVYQDSIIMDAFPDGIYFLRVIQKSGGQGVVKIIKSGPAGIREMKADFLVLIYPNPVRDWLSAEFGDRQGQDFKISISNAVGEVVYEGDCIDAKQEFDLSFINAGIYFLKIKSEKGVRVLRVVKE